MYAFFEHMQWFIYFRILINIKQNIWTNNVLAYKLPITKDNTNLIFTFNNQNIKKITNFAMTF